MLVVVVAVGAVFSPLLRLACEVRRFLGVGSPVPRLPLVYGDLMLRVTRFASSVGKNRFQ